MNPISVSAIFGILLALGVIYLLQPPPLNSGAAGLVVVLCVGASAAAGGVFKRIMRNRGKK